MTSSDTQSTNVAVSVGEPVQARSGPGTVYERVGTLEPGLSYPAIAKQTDWFEVLLDGNQVWVFSALLTISGDPATIPDLAQHASASQQPGPMSADVESASSAVRTFLRKPDLQLSFVEVGLMANSPDADRKVVMFEDDWGARYSVDQATLTLVQIEPSNLQPAIGPKLSEDQIRTKAMGLARESVAFSDLESNLQYEEGVKEGPAGTAHFFTWWDKREPTHLNLPRLQIGIYDDGTVFSYMDTLIWAK